MKYSIKSIKWEVDEKQTTFANTIFGKIIIEEYPFCGYYWISTINNNDKCWKGVYRETKDEAMACFEISYRKKLREGLHVHKNNKFDVFNCKSCQKILDLIVKLRSEK